MDTSASTAQSSTTASVDPDRLNIQYFEKGGASPQKEAIVTVAVEDSSEYESLLTTLLIGPY